MTFSQRLFHYFSYTKKWFVYKVVWRLLSYLPYKFAYPIAEKIDNRFKYKPEFYEAFKNGMEAFAKVSNLNIDVEDEWDNHLKMHSRERLDAYRLSRFNSKMLKQQVELIGLEHIQKAINNGKGVIMIMAHFGRPVLLGSAIADKGIPVNIFTGVPNKNDALDPIDIWFHQYGMKNTLRCLDGEWIKTDDHLKKIYTTLNKGELVEFMMDLPASSNPVNLPFFGGFLSIPQGILRISQKTNASLVFAVSKEIDQGKIIASIYPLNENPKEALGESCKLLQSELVKTPYQWWQWNLWPHLYTPNQAELKKNNL